MIGTTSWQADVQLVAVDDVLVWARETVIPPSDVARIRITITEAKSGLCLIDNLDRRVALFANKVLERQSIRRDKHSC